MLGRIIVQYVQYARRSETARTCMRRRMRRKTVARLYLMKSCPLRTRSDTRISCSICSASFACSDGRDADSVSSSSLRGRSRVFLALAHSSISFAGICLAGSVKSTAPLEIAASGTLSYPTSVGSCAMVKPPWSLMHESPLLPSELMPDNTMVKNRSRCASPRLQKKTSIAPSRPWGRTLSSRTRPPTCTFKSLLGG